MDKLKQWVALTVVACLAVAAGGWFLLISPKRAEAADLRSQAADQRSANTKLESDLQVLRAQAKDLPEKQAELASVSAKIPADPGLPGLVRELLKAARGSGVQLVSVSPAEPTLVQPAAPVAPAAPPQPNAQAAPPAPGAAAPAAPGAAAPAAPGTAPGPAGQLAEIPLSVNVVGDYFEIQQFLAAVEDATRALRVDQVAMVPGKSPTDSEKDDPTAVDEGRSLNATVSGFVFMAANRPAPVAASVPADAVAADAASAQTAADGE